MAFSEPCRVVVTGTSLYESVDFRRNPLSLTFSWYLKIFAQANLSRSPRRKFFFPFRLCCELCSLIFSFINSTFYLIIAWNCWKPSGKASDKEISMRCQNLIFSKRKYIWTRHWQHFLKTTLIIRCFSFEDEPVTFARHCRGINIHHILYSVNN